MEPAEILAHVRKLIEEHADGDPDRWWYANRFVFARLMLDERKVKTAIKKQLLTEDPPCCFCGKPFGEGKAIHLHRLDHSKSYTHANCALAHGRCHLKHHRASGRGTAISGQADAVGVLTKHSKRYDDSFLYGWDITPRLADALDQYRITTIT